MDVHDSREQKIEKLKEYFEKRDDVAMAFLFGSQAKGTAIPESDWDIAVYFKPAGRKLEWEEREEYSGEREIRSAVDAIAEHDADLVVLNRAPSGLALEAMRGIPLTAKNRGLYWRFLSLVLFAAEDFRRIAREWYAIKQRSHSLSDEDRHRLLRAVDFLETELADIGKFRDISQQEYLDDRDRRRNLERWVEGIAVASIDIAKIILGSWKEYLPRTYVEILEKLAARAGFGEETAKTLADFAKLRNLLAHEYLDRRFAEIRKFLDSAEAVYGKLLALAKREIEEKGK